MEKKVDEQCIQILKSHFISYVCWIIALFSKKISMKMPVDFHLWKLVSTSFYKHSEGENYGKTTL